MLKKILVSSAVLGALAIGAVATNSETVSANVNDNLTSTAVGSLSRTQIRANANGDGWTLPYGDVGAQWITSLNAIKGQQVNVLSQSVDVTSGVKWVKVQSSSVNNGQPFYVSQSQTTAQDFMFRQDTTDTYGIWSTDDSFFLTKPWGVKNAQIIDYVKNLNGMIIQKPTMITDANGTKWAKITVNGKTGYINANSLHVTTTTKVSNIYK